MFSETFYLARTGRKLRTPSSAVSANPTRRSLRLAPSSQPPQTSHKAAPPSCSVFTAPANIPQGGPTVLFRPLSPRKHPTRRPRRRAVWFPQKMKKQPDGCFAAWDYGRFMRTVGKRKPSMDNAVRMIGRFVETSHLAAAMDRSFGSIASQLTRLRTSRYFSSLRFTRCRALSMDFTWRSRSTAIS